MPDRPDAHPTQTGRRLAF